MSNTIQRCSNSVRTSLVRVVLAISMASPAVATAAGPGGYIGFGMGTASSTVDQVGIRQFSGPVDIVSDETDNAFRIFGGLRANRNFAVEMGYVDLGTTNATALTGGTGDSYKFSVSGLDLSALLIAPIGRTVDLYGRLGVYAWTSDFTTRISGITIKDSVTGEDLIVGGGVMVNLGRNAALRFELARYDVDETSAGAGNYSVATGNLMVRF